MTPREKSVVRETFAQVAPSADTAAALFYGRLFELDPTLKELFKVDTREQGRKLMQMIGLAVSKLDALDELVPAVQALGRRHAGYGVKDVDYDTVGAALLWTLQQGLGPAFTPEVKSAWTTVYGLLASTMKAAAQSVAA
jgi:hemoglobin-like flavoprotein